MSQNDDDEFAGTLFNVLLVAVLVACIFGAYNTLKNGPVRAQPGMKIERDK